MRTPDLREAPA